MVNIYCTIGVIFNGNRTVCKYGGFAHTQKISATVLYSDGFVPIPETNSYVINIHNINISHTYRYLL